MANTNVRECTSSRNPKILPKAKKIGPNVHENKTKDPQSNKTKANLKRTKLPTNWKKFVGKESEGSDNTVGHVQQSKKKSKMFHVPVAVTVPVPVYLAVSQPDDSPFKNFANFRRSYAIDCEMVGIVDGRQSMLARVSIVDEVGEVVYDTFVKPQQPVVDYRTSVSGVRPQDMLNGKDFSIVQREVGGLLKGKFLVGHALKNDLAVLYMKHPNRLIRDTSRFSKFRQESGGHTPSLRFLADRLLGIQIQTGEHNSVEDARTTMLLFKTYEALWDEEYAHM